jgi:hypothetical protein
MKHQISRLTFAFAAAATLLCARPATAQQQPGYKDPGIATIASVVIPGGGQMYSGETKKGVALLGIGMGSLVLGYAASVDGGSAAPAAVGYLVYLGTWVYGIMDAGDSAHRMNAKNGMAVGGMRVAPTVGMQPEGGTRAGLEVRF